MQDKGRFGLIEKRKNRFPLFFLPLVLFGVFALVLFSSCGEKDASARKDQQQEQFIIEFNGYKTEKKNISDSIENLGNISVFDKATVIAWSDGILEKVYVKKGDSVSKGQLLFEISNYQLELELFKLEKEQLSVEEELESGKMELEEEKNNIEKTLLSLAKMELEIEKEKRELDFMEENVAKKKILYEQGGLTEEEYKNLVFSLDAKKLEYELLIKEFNIQSFGYRDEDIVAKGYTVPNNYEDRKKLLIKIHTAIAVKKLELIKIRLNQVLLEKEKTQWLLSKNKIRSPIDGKITDLKKYIGEKVKQDEELTTIINIDTLIAKINYPEEMISKIKIGDEVAITIESINKTVKGTVFTIDPFMDSKTRTFNVDCIIKDTKDILPGMFAKIVIREKNRDEKLLIPRSAAISGEGDDKIVFTVNKENRIFRKSIEVEDFNDEFFEVVKGLNEDEIILLEPIANLTDGMLIKLLEVKTYDDFTE